MYWAPPLRTGLGGYVWNVPTAFDGKWQQKGELLYGPTGAQIVSSGEVFCSIEVVQGGYVMEGSLPSGDPPDDAKQIVLVDIVKSLSDTSITYYKAYLE